MWVCDFIYVIFDFPKDQNYTIEIKTTHVTSIKLYNIAMANVGGRWLNPAGGSL